MARFYSNENLALQVVTELRLLGHDVLTSLEAGNANSAVPDTEVLMFATIQKRILLTHNRRHFLQLHRRRTQDHAGMVLLTFDPDFRRQAERIDEALRAMPQMTNQLVRINRQG